MEHTFHKLQGSKEEEQEMKLWDKWVDEEAPDTFNFLELAKDGGFSEVKALYTHSRWISSVILILFVFYNVYSVIELDTDLIFNEEKAAKDIGVDDLEEINGKFYVSTKIIKGVWSSIYGPDAEAPHPIHVLGALELTWLTFMLLNVVYCTMMILLCTKPRDFVKWYNMQYLFWEILPVLSSYSAMKLLNAIVPTVFTGALFEKINIINESVAEGKGAVKPTLKLIFWFIVTIFSFVIGFDTFLMKLRVVSGYAQQDAESESLYELVTGVILPVIQFLVQVLGVVQLGPFVRKRLFVFIFGGEDGIMQDEETELMETWNALLARRMHREYTWWQFIAVMTSFSDEDFQSLVLNENAELKEKTIGN